MTAQFIFSRFDSCPRHALFLICAVRSSLVVVAFVPARLVLFAPKRDKQDLGRGVSWELSKKYRETILRGLVPIA